MTEPVEAGANIADMSVVVFGDRRVPRPFACLAVVRAYGTGAPEAIDAAIEASRRLIVLGDDAELAAVLTRLLRAERLDVEVAYVPRRRSRATRAYRLPTGFRAVRRARRGSARRVTLIRDETGSVVVGRACWLPPDDARRIHGEAVVDDTTLFDGDVAGVWIEPMLAAPGLRAAVAGRGPGGLWRRWVTGRAAQLGSTGVAVLRDGVPAARAARRSAFYRNIEGWLLVG
ncbi:peptidase M50 [Mycobacterium sp. 852002-51971_SCH5477799-a]|uniref:peptidase M50 n=1 Tax=Mycobacterium sp. 852002-51971_SCH5477799-a TaxID=1834106 RepID=UPI0008004623|nr:peptidase M50 [Mycobacterium sp. 852002-51971_SCH5477799-a]OBF67459.1 peptidase M50 [Mycobacterium sp. 852002-51971_SCH5477799-a]